MNTIRLMTAALLFTALSAASASAETGPASRLGENAALRYWSAFAQMQDSAMVTRQIPSLDDPSIKELIKKNQPALETMQRGTAIPNCDWGIEYQLGAQTPVEYVRKALLLGNLNALYVMYLQTHGDTDGAVRALVAGLRFSRDVANGGTLFATEVAAKLLMDHLPLIPSIVHAGISPAQRSALQKAVAQLGSDGLDWRGAVKRELGLYRTAGHDLSAQGITALAQIIPLYIGVISDPSALPGLQKMIASAPVDLRNLMPNPQRVVEGEQSLHDHLAEARALLQ